MTGACPCGGSLQREVRDTGRTFERRYRLLACDRCGLVSPDPFPAAEALEALYDGYGSYAADVDVDAALRAQIPAAERLVRRTLAELLPRGPAPARYLELGCAAGAFLAAVARVSGWACWGVEVDPRNGAVAQRQVGADRVHVGPLEGARHPDGFFGVIRCNQVIEHVPDPVALLAEARRILAPGGVALFATPNFDGLSARVLGLGWKEFAPEEHIRMFDRRSLAFHLERAGFVDVRVATQGLSLIRRDRSDALPVPRTALPVRAAAKGLGLLGLGDTLSASARRAWA